MIQSGSAKTARRISRSNISPRSAPFPTCACSGPATPSRSRSAELALNRVDGPTVLALTRQNLPQLRTNAPNDNPCAHGAYELVAAQGEAKVSLFASGSEVEIAVAAQKQLAERGIASRVVSVPSLELLLAQPADRRNAIIGNAPVKVAIEAAVRWGWDAVIGQDGEFVGMHGFGASAPAKDLYKHFGITAEAAVNAALKRLG